MCTLIIVRARLFLTWLITLSNSVLWAGISLCVNCSLWLVSMATVLECLTREGEEQPSSPYSNGGMNKHTVRGNNNEQ